MPIKPARLNPGDTVALIAPASPPPNPNAIDRSVEALKALGFRTKLATNVRQRHGFLAGTDRQRAADIMDAFMDKHVQAIFCVRGGYGASRLLPRLDYRAIHSNPKIFIGYSDVTSLHCALLKKSNLVSFHGPMLNSELIKDDLPEFTSEGLLRTLTKRVAPGSISRNYDGTVSVLRRGKASGPLLGGNLSILCATVGTPYMPLFRNRILFFEDLEEPPYRFDRMLTHLWNAGLIQQVAGVAIGINHGCIDPRAAKAKEYRQSLEDVLKERLSPLKIPVVAGLPFGHVPHNATLPIGISATLDADKGRLLIDEPAVS
jgi:muramoyltetrapeptide carboxypeptidase